MKRILIIVIMVMACFASIEVVSSLDGFGNIQAAYYHGGYVYVLSGRNIHVIDPGVPEIVDELDLGDYTMDMDFRANFVYVVNGQDVAVVDISDPTALSLVGEYDLPNYGYDIAFYGSYAYVPSLEQMTIMAIAGDGSLSAVGSISSGSTQCKSCHVQGDQLFMGKSESGLHVYTLEGTPDAPTLRGLVNTPGWVLDIESDDDYAYVADGSMVGIGDGSLCTIDLSTAPLYAITDTFVSSGGNCFEGCLAGGLYYILADGVGGVRVFSLAEPDAPVLVDSDASFTSSNVNNVDFHDDIIYAATNGTLYMLSSDEIDITDVRPPVVTLAEPINMSYTSCPNQPIRFRFEDATGVDWSSIAISINGWEYSVSDLLREGDMLSYAPMIEWPTGVPVVWSVLEVCDTEGNCASSPLAGSFIFEYDMPTATGLTPGDAATVTSARPLVRAELSDAGSGIDPRSIEFEYFIGGTRYTGVYPDDISWDGRYAILTTMPELSHGDMVEINLNFYDNVTYCGPNTGFSSWSFDVNLSGVDGTPPTANIDYPMNGSFSSVASQTISWSIVDESDIDVSSIRVTVDGVEHPVGGTTLTYSDGDLTYRHSGAWSEGAHTAIVTAISDVVGNATAGIGSTTFNIDMTAPRIRWLFPAPGGDFGSPWAVQAAIVDWGAGVNTDAVRIVIDDEEFTPIVSPEGDSAKVFTVMYGHEPDDGLISVCIENIEDDIDLGIPNSRPDSCYQVEDIYELPLNFEIISIAPNPFNPACNIELVMAEPGEVTIEAYDLEGRNVGLIYNGYVDGMLRLRWSPNLRSGVYFLRMDTPCGVNVERVMLLK